MKLLWGKIHDLFLVFPAFISGILMATDQSRASQLSAQLDFEDVSGGPNTADELDLSHLDFELDPAMTSLESLVQAPLDYQDADSKDPWVDFPAASAPATPATPAYSPPSAKAGQSAARPRGGKTSQKQEKNDRFTLYAAVIALLGLALIVGALFYFKVLGSDENRIAYLTLPETVTNLPGQTIRIQVTLQVEQKDKDWLNEHKKILGELFPIVIAKINPDDLHSEQGFQNVQTLLRKELNQGTESDKIQTVLINELLTQTRLDDQTE